MFHQFSHARFLLYYRVSTAGVHSTTVLTFLRHGFQQTKQIYATMSQAQKKQFKVLILFLLKMLHEILGMHIYGLPRF